MSRCMAGGCHSDARPGRTRCEYHAQLARERYADRKQAALCVQWGCDRPSSSGHSYCDRCVLKVNDKTRRVKREKRLVDRKAYR